MNTYRLLVRSGTVDSLTDSFEDHHNRYVRRCMVLLFTYLLLGMVVYGFVESWTPIETLLFCFSLVTGVGYGHVAPTSDAGKVFTSVYAFFGVVVFGIFVSRFLDSVVESEIAKVAAVINCQGPAAHQAEGSSNTSGARQIRFRWMSSMVVVLTLLACAIGVFVLYYGIRPVEAAYLGVVTVLQMDSICLVNDLHCSPVVWGAEKGGRTVDQVIALLWYVGTYSSTVHLAYATFRCLMFPDYHSHLKRLTSRDVIEMDIDKDGKVSKVEFLRDGLIKEGLCSEEEVDGILKNFEELAGTKDNNAMIKKRDLFLTRTRTEDSTGIR